MYYTHIAFGFLIALLFYPLFKISIIIYFSLVLLGTLLPDIDHRESIISKFLFPFSWIIGLFFKHRGIFHSLLFLLILLLVISNYFGLIYAVPLIIGITSHILLDSLTIQGINYLYPITTLKISGFIETGKTGETVFFLFLLAMIFVRLFFH